MLGSTTFSWLTRVGVSAENTMQGMLTLATLAMGAATTVGLGGGLVPLVAAFFAFEACVGMYFPLIGTLRSKYASSPPRLALALDFASPRLASPRVSLPLAASARSAPLTRRSPCVATGTSRTRTAA